MLLLCRFLFIVTVLLVPALSGAAAPAPQDQLVRPAIDPLPVGDMVGEGLKVLVIGVSGVFLFLVIMVMVVSGYAALARKLGLDRFGGASPAAEGVPAPTDAVPVAAITAAVSAYLRVTDPENKKV